ncbi:MAG TPA: hypothetical protein VEC36_12430, partial [Patescibacteria group bacterium]|nr:hypothetical protein [Patescibacteria group bacterium]
TASVSYFFSDAWGLDFSYQMFITKDYYVKHDAFYDVLENRFGSDFFVSLTADSRRDIKTGTGRSGRVLAGLMYRKRFGNLLLLPRMLIGTTFFHTNTGSAFLKEKDANNLYAISYSADKTSQGFVTLAPTFTLGYQLFKRVVIGLDAQYSYCNINFGYEEELNTLSSSQTNVLRKIPYSQQLHTISLGAGVIFTFD